jgi:hypothetical protein
MEKFMDTYVRFLYEFLNAFFSGLKTILFGIVDGIKQIFDIPAYIHLIKEYKNDFSVQEWVLVAIAIFAVALILILTIVLVLLILRKYVRFRKTIVEQESMMKEVANLNKRVETMTKEREEILTMKVSQLGLKPDESAEIPTNGENKEGENAEEDDGLRFSRLTLVDKKFAKYKVQNYNNDFTLEELCITFRNFAASRLHLYYTLSMIRIFISGLASTKLVILQGISGTGKTSLAYAWGKFLKHDSCVVSVQPSWRDRTELFGYFNEFTKKFNETQLLESLYVASYTDDVYTVILDEMNLARVEYYFAEMLSILEMPNRDEWVIEIVASSWENDPKHVINGKIKVPANTWYIGTINNDDSTFMVTDKVYDRAMPIDINDKGQVFEAEDTPPMDINFSYLDKLFTQAREEHQVSEESWKKINLMDDYVIQHFRVAFGNRIVSHLGKFVSAYVACGGDEVDGIDYFIAKKILRKFEQLNIAYIKDEIDGFVAFLDKTFGKGKMKECTEYVLRLKKLG